MSASIYYRPVSAKKFNVPESCPSQLIEALGIPRTLKESDLPELRAMARVAWNEGESFKALIEAVEKFGEIEIWAEY